MEMQMRSEYVDEVSGIYLRLMTREDTDSVLAWRNSDDVRKHFIYRELFTREGHESWIQNMIETGKAVQMIICELKTDRPLGSVYIRDIDRKHKKAEYGIFIGEASARGHGLGTAAARLMLRYSFQEAGLHRVYLRAFAENMQAVRSYEKAGFEREGLLREDVCIEGKYYDMVWMAALNPEKNVDSGRSAYQAQV